MVAFLFTDIEGSTVRWDTRREAMQAALRRHDAILRDTIESNDGHVFKTIGDAFCASFPSVPQALEAAIDAQRRIGAEDWSTVDGLRVRMAIHAGETDERSGDYFGPAVNRVARLLSVGHGGQVLVSGFARSLAGDALHDGVSLRELGTLPLKDLKEPENVYQLAAPGLESEFKPLRALQTPPNNLPRQATSFVGRHDDLARVDGLLRTNRLVTIAGTGGAGKTRLALQAANDVLNDHRDGAWFVDLAPISNPALVASTILSALGADQTGEGSPADVLTAYLKNRELLLVMDNCEHVVQEVAQIVAAILAQDPHVVTLATSREVLNVTGERVHRLGSLDIESAMRLFAERAKAANPSFAMNEANEAIVRDICERIDCIALAIELASSRLRALSVDELSRRLELRILAGGKRDREPRQQTMHALIDWGYDGLTAEEQAVFRRLSVFAGGFTLEAAARVCTDDAIDDLAVIDALTSLTDKSLMVGDETQSAHRYRLLELIRQYGKEKLERTDEAFDTRHRHAETFAAIATACYDEWDKDPAPDWLQRYEKDLGNFRSALGWTITDGNDASLGAVISWGASPVFMRLSLLREAIAWCELALERIEPPERAMRARLTYALSMLYNNQGLLPRALNAAEIAADLFRQTEELRGLIQALAQVALQSAGQGLFPKARTFAEEALLLAHNFADPRLLANTLIRCSLIYDPDSISVTRERLAESVSIFRSLGRDTEIAKALLWSAQAESEAGDFFRALEISREALALGDGVLRMYLMNMIASYELATGNDSAAADTSTEALRLASSAGHPIATAYAIVYVAASKYQRDPLEAATLLGYSEAAFMSLNRKVESFDALIIGRLTNGLNAILAKNMLDAMTDAGAHLSEEEAVTRALRL